MKLASFFSERVIAYYPQLKKITGSIESALLLQQLLYWWDKKGSETLYKTIDELEQETGLSRWEQATAIKTLKRKGFVSVELKGVPPKRHFVVDVEKIESSLYQYHKSICGDTTNQYVATPQNTIHKTTTKNTALYSASSLFEDFWKQYPRKIAKGNAQRSWEKIPSMSPELQQQIIASVEAHKETSQWREGGGKFIPHPATFLNQQRWLDEIAVESYQTDKALIF